MKQWLLHISLLLIAGALHAQVTFIATVDRNKVTVDESFELSLTIYQLEAGDVGQEPDFPMPVLKDFTIIRGPIKSTEVNLIKGKMGSRLSYGYYLKAKEEGSASIPPIMLTYEGKTYQTEQIDIKVIGNKEALSPYYWLEDQVFLELSVDKDLVYKGEQLIATYTLYTHPKTLQLSYAEIPTYDNFLSYDLEIKNNSGNYSAFPPTMIFNGVPFTASVVKKVALTPLQEGEWTIDSLKLKTQVRLGGSSLNQLYNSNTKTVPFEFGSNTATIKVKPLPEGQPEDFSNLVGDFTIQSTIDKKIAPPGGTIYLNITITGLGSLQELEPPQLEIPPGFELVDIEVDTVVTPAADSVKNIISFDYILVPHQKGSFKVNGVGLTYFNPEKEDYLTLLSDSHNITVKGRAPKEKNKPNKTETIE